MGTPHQGANTTLGKLILSIASIAIKTNRSLPRTLERDGEWLEVQMRSYLPISDDFKTVYCYETKPMGTSRELVCFYFASAQLALIGPRSFLLLPPLLQERETHRP
jgi:hypothetical protein